MKTLIIILISTISLFGQQTKDTFTSGYFGFDFWSSNINFWQEVYQQMEEDSFPFYLVGSDAINWQKIEPYAPKNGVHQYNWNALDPFMKTTQEAGKVLELGIRPASNWGTVVKADEIDNWALGMSPILPDLLSDTLNWGMTAGKAWYDFIYNLVERYDGDGFEDAPWCNRLLIKSLSIGNEPEAPSHFFDYGGTMKAFHEILSISYRAAKDANESVIIARGKSNSGRMFDDSPDSGTIMERGGYYLDSLMADFELGSDDYDVFAINYNDHYTQLPVFVQWLKKEMGKRGIDRPFIVGDARTTLCPRDNYYNKNNRVLPPVYTKEFMEILEDPNHAQYPEVKKIHQKDEVMQSIKKIVMATVTGQKQISLQPVFSELQSYIDQGRRKYMWFYSGFFDPYIYDSTGDLALAREPVYWAMKQLANQLIGCDKNIIEHKICDNCYVYEYNNDKQKFFIAWHEDNTLSDETTGLRKRNQSTTIDLSFIVTEPLVEIKSFTDKTNENGLPIQLESIETNTKNVIIDEFPVLIFPKQSSSTNKIKIDKIDIFPNPFSSRIFIEMEQKSKANIKLMDLSGKIVQNKNINCQSVEINTSKIKPGIYFLLIKTNGQFISKKIVKASKGR